jgi:hypothetical protein
LSATAGLIIGLLCGFLYLRTEANFFKNTSDFELSIFPVNRSFPSEATKHETEPSRAGIRIEVSYPRKILSGTPFPLTVRVSTSDERGFPRGEHLITISSRNVSAKAMTRCSQIDSNPNVACSVVTGQQASASWLVNSWPIETPLLDITLPASLRLSPRFWGWQADTTREGDLTNAVLEFNQSTPKSGADIGFSGSGEVGVHVPIRVIDARGLSVKSVLKVSLLTILVTWIIGAGIPFRLWIWAQRKRHQMQLEELYRR